MLYNAPATENLTVADQLDLITAAQSCPSVNFLDLSGNVIRTRYTPTPESDEALETLTRAFLPAIRKASRYSRTLDADGDAFGIVLAAFVDAVRRYDTASDLPFSATIATILARSISDADRTSGVVAVKENVAARYFRLIHKHDGDIGAAYDECRTTPNGFDPLTFLAVHRALMGADSLDGPAFSNSDSPRPEGSPLTDPGASFVDEFADRDLVRWLFTAINDRQESICRAVYGFADSATENLLVASGFRPGEVLSDVQASAVLSLGRATVQRDRMKALDAMRAAYRGLIDADELDA